LSEPVAIVGLGGDGLAGLTSLVALVSIRSATFLAGGRRNLALIGPTDAETFVIADNVDTLISRLRRRGPDERCTVLASGDPLFYGIGDRIVRALGMEQVRVTTSLSSMQQAFARVGLPWHDAAIASVHGRPLGATLVPLLGRRKLGLFTRDGASPAEVARFFAERGRADAYDAWVCENLGTADEAVIADRLVALVERRFADLNVLILLDRRPPRVPPEPIDANFARPESGAVLLTHEDVRAVVVRRFQGLGEGPIWDVGAGLGGVSVALARAFPDREVVAVERAAAQLAFLKENRARFEAFTIRVVEGEAPGCLIAEDAPAGVFLGGSGGQLDPILGVVADRLRPGGRLVANFVGLENLMAVVARLQGLGWPYGLTQVQVAEGRPLAGLTTLVPERPVWIVRAEKPGDSLDGGLSNP
jgi:precorrin-6Y C5,15-methyltransferase (decarboxylating)